MWSVMVYFRVASQLAAAHTTKLREITMTQDHTSITRKPCLDDLLATMGITPEQLRGMTADDLFAAATRWQDGVAAAARPVAAPADRLLDKSSTYKGSYS